jgi:hypothetical protein
MISTGNNAMRTTLAIGLLAAVLAGSRVEAHHGNSEFDMSQELRYEGTLTSVQWKNPHIMLTLETRTPEGKQITLTLEGASPNVLRVGGFDANSLVPGDAVIAVVSPSRRFPEQSAYGYQLIKLDGTVVPLVSAGLKRTLTTATTDVITGSWVATAESFATFVRELRSWPLTPAAAEIRGRFTPKDSGQARCIPVAAPMLMMYPVVSVLTQEADHIRFDSEWLGATRLFYTDGRAHPPADERFQQGHSVVHWEGQTLVVDTTNYSDQETGGVPSGSRRHLVETFRLGADGRSLEYGYTLEDADYLQGQITGTARFDYRPDLQHTAAECDADQARSFFREFV